MFAWFFPKQCFALRGSYGKSKGRVRLGYALWVAGFVCAGMLHVLRFHVDFDCAGSLKVQRHRFTGGSCTFSDMKCMLHGCRASTYLLQAVSAGLTEWICLYIPKKKPRKFQEASKSYKRVKLRPTLVCWEVFKSAEARYKVLLLEDAAILKASFWDKTQASYSNPRAMNYEKATLLVNSFFVGGDWGGEACAILFLVVQMFWTSCSIQCLERVACFGSSRLRGWPSSIDQRISNVVLLNSTSLLCGVGFTARGWFLKHGPAIKESVKAM